MLKTIFGKKDDKPVEKQQNTPQQKVVFGGQSKEAEVKKTPGQGVGGPMSTGLSASVDLSNNNSYAEEVATVYAEGEDQRSIEMLTKYINDKKGQVSPRFWYMLMDIYQVKNNKSSFEKAALLFANTFSCSPPSWKDGGGESEDSNVMAGDNVLILDGPLTIMLQEKLKDFLKSARQQKFCRIDVSRTKFEQSDIQAIKLIIQLMNDLRKYKVLSVLMGENQISQFCLKYIDETQRASNPGLNQHLLDEESTLHLLYLEVLQWKGRMDEFEERALNFAIKFEISPPGWDDKGVMQVQESISSENEDETADKIDTILNGNNIEQVTDLIKTKLSAQDKAEIDFESVERIDFAGAGGIVHGLQELLFDGNNEGKKIIIKNVNECILVLFEMVGATEFLEIQPKQR